MVKLFAFDRDFTVNVNEGPVPLSWIKQLAKSHEVWAIGNPLLRGEANIPGVEDMKSRMSMLPKPKSFGHLIGEHKANVSTKIWRMQNLNLLFPDISICIIVDDFVSEIMGNWVGERDWIYSDPQDFVNVGLEAWERSHG